MALSTRSVIRSRKKKQDSGGLPAMPLSRRFQRLGYAVERDLNAIEFPLGRFIPLQQPALSKAFADPALRLSPAFGKKQPANPTQPEQGQGYIDFAHVRLRRAAPAALFLSPNSIGRRKQVQSF
jgi:hypothetical protein